MYSFVEYNLKVVGMLYLISHKDHNDDEPMILLWCVGLHVSFIIISSLPKGNISAMIKYKSVIL